MLAPSLTDSDFASDFSDESYISAEARRLLEDDEEGQEEVEEVEEEEEE